MSTYETSDEHRPVMWLRGYPVYAAHFIVIVFVLSMLATVLVSYAGFGSWLEPLILINGDVLRGHVWELFSYGLVNPLPTAGAAWQFAMDMAMFIWFGRDVERHFGLKKFLIFFGIIYLISPLVLTLVGLWIPLPAFFGEKGALAVFIAYAVLFPSAPVFFAVEARWAAVIAVAVYTVVALNNHDNASLLSHWSAMTFAYFFTRHHLGYFELPKINLFKRGPKLRVLPDLPAEKKKPSAKASDSHVSSMAEVDALLDKIAQSGMGSLTAKERAKLDAARAELLKRESGRR